MGQSRRDLTQLTLDGIPLDLRRSTWILTNDPAQTSAFVFAEDDSPTPGVPLLVRMEVDCKSTPTPAGGRNYERGVVESLILVEQSATVTLSRENARFDGVHRLRFTQTAQSVRRPPFLCLKPEDGTDGLWDLTTADSTSTVDVQVEDLDLSDDLKGDIRAWMGDWATEQGTPSIQQRQFALAERIRAELPHSWIDVQLY